MSDIDENDANVGFLFKAMRNRDPRKRRVKPVSKHLLQVNFCDFDSENDSDYQVNEAELSDDEKQNEANSEDDSNDESDSGSDDSDDDDDDDDDDEKEKDESPKIDITESNQSSRGASRYEESFDEEESDSDDDDDDDDGSDESDDDDDDGPIGSRSKNLWDAINSDDTDDEDYVPKKKQKQSEKHIVEKQRIRSPEVKPKLVPVDEETKQARPMKVLICCVCLGDISETDDEIVECDNCGVAVHEGCYGISDNISAASTESSASTEPWFCDACKAGVKPDCELCPNEGGIFKETDAGKWVHLVCALYTPGVAFGDVDKLSPVTLFEMPYAKWGLKECSLCEDARFSRTGVCVSCDAGMCRSYFHVTCAQRNGLLSEASPDEDIADPFYAYCKLHADKIAARAKRRNWLAIQSHVRQHASTDILDEKEKARFKRKLNRHRQRYLVAKGNRPPAWVPPQKMVRFLTSSPSAVKKMLKKAELMGIITQTQHVVHSSEKQQERKKSHIAPAMSAEFITYYLDRNVRLEKLKADMKDQEKHNEKLVTQDNTHRLTYDQLMKESGKIHDTNHKLRKEGEKLWSLLSDLAGKPLQLPEILKPKKASRSPTRKEILKSPTTVINQCGICQRSHDQHLLARCDKCHKWYHLGCLDPPLTRMPKKTSRMGWQCSECTEVSSDDSEETPTVNVNAPRRLRDKIKEPAKLSHTLREMEFLFPKGNTKKGQQKKRSRNAKKQGSASKKDPKKCSIGDADDDIDIDIMEVELLDGSTTEVKHTDGTIPEIKNVVAEDQALPRTPISTVNVSDESSMEVELKIIEQTTPIPKQHPQFQDVSRTGRKIIKKKHYDDDDDSSDISPKLNVSSGSSTKKSPEKELVRSSGVKSASSTPKKLFGTECVTCGRPGDRTNMVSCDVCDQCYHFTCLNPPHKKTPKQRGYTWHCEACDTGSEDSEEEEEDAE